MTSPHQLKQLALFLGLAEVAIKGDKVMYHKPGYEFHRLYHPNNNAEQSQDIQQHLKISVRHLHGRWDACIDLDRHVVSSGDTLRDAILNVAVKYVETVS